jgi:hypothetical protein
MWILAPGSVGLKSLLRALVQIRNITLTGFDDEKSHDHGL